MIGIVGDTMLVSASLTHAVRVTLKYPNVATDEFGVEGTWTLIYNQGFEVIVNGRIYFAFSNYRYQLHNYHYKVVSICNETKPGWAHDVHVRDWSCFKGTKVTRVPSKVNDDITRYVGTQFLVVVMDVTLVKK